MTQQQPHKPVHLSGLCPADAQVLDELIEANARRPRQGGSPSDAAGLSIQADYAPFPADPKALHRRKKMEDLLGVLACAAVEEPPQDLVARTLAKVNGVKQNQRFTDQIRDLSRPDLGLRWREFVAVAAAIVIGVSVSWPALQRSREHARRVACSDNLATVGAGIASYAQDANNALPRGQVRPGSAWYRVGQSPSADGSIKSNSANLYLLVTNNYVSPELLACPENPFAPRRMDASMHDWPSAKAVSYSYQNQYSPHKISLDRVPQLPILADKNPLFDIKLNQLTVRRGDPLRISEFHRNLGGQNVLTADGNVLWAAGPVMRNGDNIWLIRGVDIYKGKEVPKEMGDAFLVP